MKKTHFLRALAVLAFAAGMSLFSVSAVQAQSNTGCDPNIQAAMQDIAGAVQTRDNAVINGMITQPEPSAGLTCMDQALAVTGRLGNIFSDRHDDDVPAANTIVYTPPLLYPDWGAGDFLVNQLYNAITPILAPHLESNFANTIAMALGATALSTKLTGLIDSIGKIVSKIYQVFESINGKINAILSAIETVQKIAKLLNLPMPSPVIVGTVAALEAAQKILLQLVNELQSAMNSAIKPLIGEVLGEIMAPATDIECENIDKLWKDGNPNDGIKSVQGEGLNTGVPFAPLSQLVAGDFTNSDTNWLSVMQSGDSMNILNRAQAALTSGALSGPGATSSWPAPIRIDANAGTSEVIQQMGGGGGGP